MHHLRIITDIIVKEEEHVPLLIAEAQKTSPKIFVSFTHVNYLKSFFIKK